MIINRLKANPSFHLERYPMAWFGIRELICALIHRKEKGNHDLVLSDLKKSIEQSWTHCNMIEIICRRNRINTFIEITANNGAFQ